MSFTRKNYDKTCYDQYLKSVHGIEQHTLEVPAPCNSNGCFNSNPQVRHGSLGNSTVMRDIDAETSLRNIDYKLGCDKRPANCVDGVCKTQMLGGDEKRAPSCDFTVNSTRLDNPASNIRGTGINRFEYPLTITPLHENRIGLNLNSRLLVKDNYRLQPEIPINISAILPEGGNLQCSKTTPVCGAYGINEYKQ